MLARIKEWRPADSARQQLFVYGSLVKADCLDEVLGRHYAGDRQAAQLRGFRRVLGTYPYPFIVAARGHSVDGVVLLELSADDLNLLDGYEEIEAGVYSRQLVHVGMMPGEPGSVRVQAYAYVAGPRLLAGLSTVHESAANSGSP